MRKIIVLDSDEFMGQLGRSAREFEETDIVVRRVVRYEVIKNRHGAWGQTVDTLDDLTG